MARAAIRSPGVVAHLIKYGGRVGTKSVCAAVCCQIIVAWAYPFRAQILRNVAIAKRAQAKRGKCHQE
eukprot:11218625-Lingulodinium_polyedra.AAC.1